MAPPQLMDEIIGHILSQLQPGVVEGLFQVENADTKTLKTCSLVSHQFGFWSRRNLYRKLHIKGPQHVSHYLSLLQRYTDMASHIKYLTVATTKEDGMGEGYDNLISMLDRLTLEGAVVRAKFSFGQLWDSLKLELQNSILRFILSRSFECICLEGICPCFPLGYLTLPWLAKRFFLSYFAFKVASDGSGGYRMACPHREKERIEKGTSQVEEGDDPHPSTVETIETALTHLYDDGVLHPQKTVLESLWMPSEMINSLVPHLTSEASNSCVRTLRELHFFRLFDHFIPHAVGLIQECKDTLESLGIMNLHVRSATSSHLASLASIELPRLHTLTIMTHLKSTGEPGEATKSVAWFLLHANKHKRFRLRSLNILATDSTFYGGPLTPLGVVGNLAFIHKLFNFFSFFKLEKVVTGLLVPNTGRLGIWVLMGTLPGQTDKSAIEKRLQTDFPDLYREGRATGMVGMFQETTKIADALSILLEGPAVTGYHGTTAI